MKGTLLAICLHLVLAGIVYAATATEPCNPSEYKPLFSGDYAGGVQIKLYGKSGEIVFNNQQYILEGKTEIGDNPGEWVCIEIPTGNKIKVFADGSADVNLNGQTYTFTAEE